MNPGSRRAAAPVAAALAVAAWAAVALAAAGAGGCTGPRASLQFASGEPDQAVRYDSATFQLARGGLVQVVLFRRTPAPLGEADPDFEYVFFELPERSRYGWVHEDNAKVWRWVRQREEDGTTGDRCWHGASGDVKFRFSLDRHRLHMNVRSAMVPLGATEGSVYVLRARVDLREDMPRTQGLINRYGDWLRALLEGAAGASEAN